MTALYAALSELTSREELIDMVLEGRVEIDRLRAEVMKLREYEDFVDEDAGRSIGFEAWQIDRVPPPTNEHGDGE